MTTTMLAAPRRLSDAELLAQVARLAARERDATVALIAHLAELAAYGRIEAARAARRYPLVLERLADGSVTLTTVTLLAPHLTPDNHRDLLDAARHKSRREVEAMVAALRPQPAVPASVRGLPIPRQPLVTPPPVETSMVGPPAPEGSDGVPVAASAAPAGAAPVPPARPPVVVPLAPERYNVRFTASAETYARLRLAQDLLRHQIPDGDLGQVLDRALTVLVDALTKQKLAATTRPRTGRRPGPGSRHIPAAVRRAVWARDGGRCAFVSQKGRRCAEGGRLEFHHVRPYAAGGAATVENIQLRCRAHNGYEAAQVFGPFGPSCVREPASVYATPGRALAPGRTRFGPSWAWAARPP